ncbi:MAG: type II toxin-antitoxin system RelE/ParE family toxin [Roseburia sp.]|nr:type II toxin-antitoxin system RelE/ParE family toxin [Roseburia sp.]
MKFEVKYSKNAIRDLDRVWSEVYEVSKSHDITIKYMDELMDKVEAKANYPKSGSPLYYEDSFTGYYFIVFKAYMAFYHLEDNKMLVDRILYGKSDYMRCLHIYSDEES